MRTAFLSILAAPLAALLYAGPVAATGNDFCDGHEYPSPLARNDEQPAGGRCEVDMLYADHTEWGQDSTQRRHELFFDPTRLPAFGAGVPIVLDVGVRKLDLRERPLLVEWSFVSEKTGEQRLLAVIVRRERTADGRNWQIVALAQWYAPVQAGWSLADPSFIPDHPQQHTRLQLAPGRPLSAFALAFDGAQVGVSLEGGGKASFVVTGSAWVPLRLRNAILTEAPLPAMAGAWLSWPESLYRYSR